MFKFSPMLGLPRASTEAALKFAIFSGASTKRASAHGYCFSVGGLKLEILSQDKEYRELETGVVR